MSHELLDNQFWITGPDFVRDIGFDFRTFERELQAPKPSCDTALKKPIEHSVISAHKFQKPTNNLSSLIGLERSNDFDKLVRVAAYVLQFASRRRRQGELTSDEVIVARRKIIISEQQSDERSRGKDFLKDKANLKILSTTTELCGAEADSETAKSCHTIRNFPSTFRGSHA